jgi:deazaflavin-dependent oxidoreductase (nitroreductase family)
MTIELPPQGSHGGRGFGGTPARISNRLAAAVYRATGGRASPKTLLLTTTGARSGEQRVATMRRFDEGAGRWLVVGSAGGGAKHPAWAFNVARNPDRVWVEVGKDRFKVRPELLAAEERAAAWQRIVREASNFGRYETKTDREIPVFRLTRESAGSSS